ncbi:hypothetical protein QR680_000793 [Steinernema hermaphroditum]|uniref:protein-tyrosine-phosphatase n=1 Tax=Steinernema hermaphroditum TaxID=289476 RepID=A0AA39GVV5_9BILA|nr:hypothetical protein QR680_000793 [Steinernema hermaphroditum]
MSGTPQSTKRPTNFFFDVTGHEAVNFLKKYGNVGEFLARPSGSTPGNYTLSVKVDEEKVTHVKIQNNGDFLDLFGGEMFASLHELVQFYMENPGQLKERSGDAIVNIVLKRPVVIPASQEPNLTFMRPTSERYFHMSMNAIEAEELLKSYGREGSYLVRESQRHPGDYVLCVKIGEEMVHQIWIRNENSQFDIGGGDRFESLSSLIEHHSRIPIVIKDGTPIILKAPLPSTRMIASAVEGRRQRLEQKDRHGNEGFYDEFERLQASECCLYVSMSEGKKPDNIPKNRYKNILPFDHTRIKLDLEDGAGDYINASLIQMLPTQYPEFAGLNRKYISTQGCLSSTVHDFWRMMWQTNSRVIVMTTKEYERGRVGDKMQEKCYRYWPQPGGSEVHGGVIQLIVDNKSEARNENYVMTVLELRKIHREIDDSETLLGERRTIYHFQFLGWPDHGCPSDSKMVLDFLDQVNECRDTHCPKTGPIVVHCSAGIGRTGTFIVIDILINQIKRIGSNCQIDISNTVKMVREQRSGMVQTEHQYRFLYRAIACFMESTTKANRGRSLNSGSTAELCRVIPSRHKHHRHSQHHAYQNSCSSTSSSSNGSNGDACVANGNPPPRPSKNAPPPLQPRRSRPPLSDMHFLSHKTYVNNG